MLSGEVCVYKVNLICMINKILYKLNSGKNRKIGYFVKNYARTLVPTSFYRAKLEKALEECKNRPDYEYIKDRVDYYNKLSLPEKELIKNAKIIGEHKIESPKVYFFDSYIYTRWFDKKLRWHFLPGDITFVPECPGVVKSRPLTDNNQNSVLLKLDKVRHFIFVKDKKRFSEKSNRAIFMGKIGKKENRVRFMEMFFGHPMVDVGDVSRKAVKPEWKAEKMTISQHLDYKFIMALEGNDVASNLKWVMSSNSLAVMPKPTCETWFMEGRLIPNYHYVEVKPDFSDLEERMKYYIEHEEEAEAIIKNAHEYVEQFKNEKREDLISLLVLDKYFKCTKQDI